MSTFGLSPELIKQQPWGLPAPLLKASKTNTDPIHGDVYLTELERSVVDTPSFQRLRRVLQLGNTHLVYPGATHTRFSHSLGALRVAQDLLDKVFDRPETRNSPPTLFDEWESPVGGKPFLKRKAESIVLGRLGALLHDLCHVPFGHTIEDDLKLLKEHDSSSSRFDRVWEALQSELGGARVPDALALELRAIILSKEARCDLLDREYAFISDLVGNTVCADLLDYLPRDFYYTGLKASLGSRFLSYFYVTPSTDPTHPRRMAIEITKRGHRRTDVVSEILKYLRYRYELSERALYHHAKVAADAMLGHALSALLREVGTDEVEDMLLRSSDDGVLVHLIESGIPVAAELGAAVRERRLYKELLWAPREQNEGARSLYEQYGEPKSRTSLERRIAEVAEIDEHHHVLLSIPDPSMRLKPADVLVHSGKQVLPLKEWDLQNGKRAHEIYESHANLWAARIFVSPILDARTRRRIVGAANTLMRPVEWSASGSEGGMDITGVAVQELIEGRNLRPTEARKLKEAAHAEMSYRASPNVDPTISSIRKAIVDTLGWSDTPLFGSQ